jgi:hypothetical protein
MVHLNPGCCGCKSNPDSSTAVKYVSPSVRAVAFCSPKERDGHAHIMIETFIQAIENKNSRALAHILIVPQESKYFIPVEMEM